MTRRSRRAFLGLLTALTGCSGADAPTSANSPNHTSTALPSATPSATPSDAPTSASATPTIRLEPTDPRTDATLVVYPIDLGRWLRRAARTGETLRVHAPAHTVMPVPPLPAFDRVRLTDPERDVDGWYAVRAEGGVRYRYLAGATAATPPDDATVTPVSDLPERRQQLVLAAIDDGVGGRARFYPETALGEWARTTFFGGYVRHDGVVYRGREVQQTDAAFFSDECWYVLSLEPVDGGTGPELDLSTVDGTVRSVVDDLLALRTPDEPATADAGDVSDRAIRFVEETDYLLTHAAVLATSVE